jgi:hypothetical protein
MFDYYLLTWNNFDRNGTPYFIGVPKINNEKVTLQTYSLFIFYHVSVMTMCFLSHAPRA